PSEIGRTRPLGASARTFVSPTARSSLGGARRPCRCATPCSVTAARPLIATRGSDGAALAEAVAWTGAGAESGEGAGGTVALTDLPSDAAVAAVGGARRAGRVAVVTAAPAQLRRIGVVVEEG